MTIRGLGLWRVKHLREWIPRDGPELGYSLALRKHLNLLRSFDAPKRMPPLQLRRSGDPVCVHFMAGESHWHLTCFCIHSLLTHSSLNLIPILHDDGTLRAHQWDEMRRIIPRLQLVTTEQAEALVDEHLPCTRFPALRKIRAWLPLMRKILDVHAGGSGTGLFLDSDILFYREPVFLDRWLRESRQPIYMKDFQDSYGYSAEVLRSAFGKSMPPRVNTGISGLYSPSIDWDRLEYWASRLPPGEVNHFAEQALTAMLMSESGGQPAPPEDYVISPERQEVRNPQAVMHHYVVPSRTWYYIDAIPQFMKEAISNF
jgi:hypothetical protein